MGRAVLYNIILVNKVDSGCERSGSCAAIIQERVDTRACCGVGSGFPRIALS